MGTFLAPFLLGIGTAASPCLLPLYPGFIAYLAGNGAGAGRGTAILGLAVVGGVLTRPTVADHSAQQDSFVTSFRNACAPILRVSLIVG